MDSDANLSEMGSGASDSEIRSITLNAGDATFLTVDGSWRLALSVIGG